MPRCQPRGKNDESVPKSSRDAPADRERGSKTASRRRARGCSESSCSSSTCRDACWRRRRPPSAPRANRPAPKCGMMNGTSGKAGARRDTASGSPSARSKRLGSPSLSPDADRQESAVHEHDRARACRRQPRTTRSVRSSSSGHVVHRREEADARQPVFGERASRAAPARRRAEGSIMKKPTIRRGMPRDRRGDRRLVARHAGDERRAAARRSRPARDPAVRERVGVARDRPTGARGTGRDGLRRAVRASRTLLRERLEDRLARRSDSARR